MDPSTTLGAVEDGGRSEIYMMTSWAFLGMQVTRHSMLGERNIKEPEHGRMP